MTVHRLSNLLDDSLKRAGIDQKVKAAQVIEGLRIIIQKKWGKQALNRITPKYLKDGILTINVRDSVYLAELKLEEDKIIKELNQKYKKATVKRMRLLIN